MLRTIESILNNDPTRDVAPPGKFRVMGEDRWDHSRFVVHDYDTAAEALSMARAFTLETASGASDPGVADGYEVYDEQGRYLGGEQPLVDWWEANKLKGPVSDRAAAIAERFDLTPLLHRAAHSAGLIHVNPADLDLGAEVCRRAATSLGWNTHAVLRFGGGGSLLAETHLLRCQAAGAAIDIEFRLKLVWGDVDVEIHAFRVLEAMPEPLLIGLTAIVKEAEKALAALASTQSD